jgi:site-specific DNA-methyltransferase (adenine-specific)
MKADVILGDCKEVLKGLESDSFDSFVTDPPAGIAFMGKSWDAFESLMHFQDEMAVIFKEVLRVMKPGAHGLVWALPRTSHHTAMALERAGFEIRDTVTHLFGVGMPKGLDVSKAIDKMVGATREAGRPYVTPEGGQALTTCNNWQDTTLKNTTQGRRTPMVTTAASDKAKQWEGWNTALKPAHEVWWLVRKPLGEKTVAAQVLSTGTGAINVDACRVQVSADDFEEMSGRSGCSTPNQVYGKGAGRGLSLEYGTLLQKVVGLRT